MALQEVLTHGFIQAAIVFAAPVVAATSSNVDGNIVTYVQLGHGSLTDWKGNVSKTLANEGFAMDFQDRLSETKSSLALWNASHRGWAEGAVKRIESLRRELNSIEEEYEMLASNALKDAESLLAKLLVAGLKARPAVGWDSEGAIALYVSCENFSADFSVPGDGTYSFSAKKGATPALLCEEQVGGPLPKKLVSMLS
jgi:hypothetical protein